MIVLVVGTNRPQSRSRKVALQIKEHYSELTVPVRILDLAELPIEVFSPAAYAQKPASFAPFSDAILQAAGLVIIVPEYNGGPPGVLKYFIDLLKFPESLDKRPVCFVGLASGMWGGLRPVEHMQQVFGYRNAFIYPERVFLPNANQLLDQSDRIADAEVAGRLKKQAAGFVEFIERVKGIKLRTA